MAENRSRAAGALYGLAVGDALGMPTQSLPRARIEASYGPLLAGFEAAPVGHPLAAGLPAGSVTDDTEQALLLAGLLIDGGGVIMLGSPGAGFRGPAALGEVTQLVCITITDLDDHRARAEAAGASVSEVSGRASQARSYTVDDPEGHRWYFSEPI